MAKKAKQIKPVCRWMILYRWGLSVGVYERRDDAQYELNCSSSETREQSRIVRVEIREVPKKAKKARKA